MKVGRLGLSGITDRVVARFRPQNELGGAFFYSTSSSTTTAALNRKSWRSEAPPEASHEVSLYRRLSQVPLKVSVVPVLDQWIDEGWSVDKLQLQGITKELRHFRKYSHALEVSMWMSDKRYFMLTRGDIAIRLDLISKVYGVEEAEKFFNTVPKQLRSLEVYGALLNCCAHAKSVEKAEAVLQVMKDLDLAKEPLTYNVMLNLYHQTGNTKKFDALLCEMGENGIRFDRFTYTIMLNAHAAVSDLEGMEKILIRMKADTKVSLDWIVYCALANAYAKVGLQDKALEMMKISETLIPRRKRNAVYDGLLTQYAAIGEKNEVLRLWRVYKEKEKVYNTGYASIIASVLKFDDFEAAEEIFYDWESQNLNYHVLIPNLLIRAYSRKGLLKKAENLVNRVISKGGEPGPITWQYFSTAYVENNQPSKAVEMMKKSVVVCKSGFKPHKETLAACLAYLKKEGDPEKIEEFIQLLGDKGIIPIDVQVRLLNHMKDGNSNDDAIVDSLDDSLAGGETLAF